jgi:hypothetical protein
MRHCRTCTCGQQLEPLIINVDAPFYDLVLLIEQQIGDGVFRRRQKLPVRCALFDPRRSGLNAPLGLLDGDDFADGHVYCRYRVLVTCRGKAFPRVAHGLHPALVRRLLFRGRLLHSDHIRPNNRDQGKPCHEDKKDENWSPRRQHYKTP